MPIHKKVPAMKRSDGVIRDDSYFDSEEMTGIEAQRDPDFMSEGDDEYIDVEQQQYDKSHHIHETKEV